MLPSSLNCASKEKERKCNGINKLSLISLPLSLYVYTRGDLSSGICINNMCVFLVLSPGENIGFYRFSHKLKHINNAHFSGITSTQLCNTKTWSGLGTTEQTLVSSERGREATEEGKSDLFSSYLCLNAENTVRISNLAFPFESFFICMLHTKRKPVHQFAEHFQT